MHCPQCKGYRLEPKLLEPDLLAASCKKCGGALLSLLNYRHWSEHHSAVHEVEKVEGLRVESGGDEVDDNHTAQLCPKCGRMMTKFRIGLENNNRIDLCSGCDEAWLDNGEWRLLKQLELHEKLPKIFTDEWQRNIRQQRQQQLVKSKYIALFGDEDFSKVDEFKNWLDQHPDKAEIKQYLIINYD
ncbi:hypothetical protein [Motiliproteus sp. MSK22-1]|uniref:TFIIB-type zinc ribbon-containing protein n=1 Tax=Motiliproteus sp. MSK22-1 TaxID=1897630 RepID=UPI000975ABE3|nr:hypothetical protein [Motiliproteus sp. MSK22-1]OMH33743.1 hypothetical protein BGP75_12145 [Motiliproteus sp. MSK22-1]